ncbi:MAG: flagellar basal body P-ring formation chaperone FlgA [Bacteroidota bacterium]|jgi:flagella basal body P-ring formation protein FlgA|nr:flagellar basal body P-ring formation protein FlgA [Ignavibacteria bacterium]MCU7499364.1 flagellar basal body P-ring formation protein FlgA [Ignavibacteria bacterium]MCU7518935.1 flagellar basal body P-ring formation protein FlgA [Ignavibacteria bacterium]MCU7525157.1 flagellar basal body P-ring formation protein FlgA [Ignavibacteria bacterium]
MKLLYLLIPFVFTLQAGDSLKEEIGKLLSKKLQGYEKISFEITSKPLTPMGEAIVIDTVKEIKVSGSTAYVPVVLVGRDKRTSQSFVSLKLSLYKKVLTAKKLFAAGSELKPEDFELKTLEVAKLRGVPVCEAGAIEHMKAKLTIKEGEALIQEKLQAMPVVKRGDSVTAFAVKGNVEISFDAQARQDGSVGEVIRIMTPEKKIFRARVIDQYSVKIAE